MISNQFSIIITDSSYLIPALISIEAELFSLDLYLSGLFGEHVVEGLIFILKQVVF